MKGTLMEASAHIFLFKGQANSIAKAETGAACGADAEVADMQGAGDV